MDTHSQCTGAFAMNHTDAKDAELLALTEIIHEHLPDLTRLESVEIQLVRDFDLDWLIVRHAASTVWAISVQSASTSFGPREDFLALENQ